MILNEQTETIQYPFLQIGKKTTSSRIISNEIESKDLLINFPKEYLGLHDEKLQNITGIKTAKFIHASGFLASTETLEDAILLAKKALENKE